MVEQKLKLVSYSYILPVVFHDAVTCSDNSHSTGKAGELCMRYSPFPMPFILSISIFHAVILRMSCAGSGVIRIEPFRFVAGCRKRRLNQALSIFLLV